MPFFDHMNYRLSILAVALALSSCSVKEDRSWCPCWLEVFCEDVPSGGLSLGLRSVPMNISRNVSDNDFSPSYQCRVPRTDVRVFACELKPGVAFEGGTYCIAEGAQCDSIYACSSLVDCDCEHASDTIRMRKQFATVVLRLSESPGLEFPYRVLVRGSVSGMDLSRLEPEGGLFLFSPVIQDGSHASFRLPRQNPQDELKLDLYQENDFVCSLDLDAEMLAAGYDWLADDLEDISVNLSASVVDVDISVNLWTEVDFYEEKI